MVDYEPVIGLEVHAELLTRSKMFCGCQVVDSVTAPPNTAVCPVCLGLPGMLPVINRRAVEMAILVGLALNCRVQRHNVFARKNYFYPDLPKGYQISQYELPLCVDGWLDIDRASGLRQRIGIRRVHMEEDTGKLTHLDGGGSLVDYNRSGVPLLEIVSEPDLRSAEEVVAYASLLRQILRYLEVNTGDMETGVIRFEANISLRPAGSDELGTRTEVKNLNSFRSLAASTEYEIARQTRILAAGGTVEQETLGWHEGREETYSQRSKEEAHDYRYFPEPDLPPLAIDPAWVEALRAELPELPAARRARLQAEHGLSSYDAGVLTEDRPVAEWFDAAVAAAGADVAPKAIANWMINNLFALLNEHRLDIRAAQLSPPDLVGLIRLVEAGTLNHNTAKEVLAEMFVSGREAKAIVADRGLARIGDEATIAEVVARVLAANPAQVAEFHAGKEKLRGWFVGQVMRATRGQADPGLVSQILARQLEPPDHD